MSVVFVTVLELSTTEDVLVSLRGSAIVKAHLMLILTEFVTLKTTA